MADFHSFPKDSMNIEWSDVREIVAYKFDAFSYDVICLAFRFARATGDEWSEINEEQDGFDSIVSEVERRFAVPEGWWSRVAFPAFEENRTTLWKGAD